MRQQQAVQFVLLFGVRRGPPISQCGRSTVDRQSYGIATTQSQPAAVEQRNRATSSTEQACLVVAVLPPRVLPLRLCLEQPATTAVWLLSKIRWPVSVLSFEGWRANLTAYGPSAPGKSGATGTNRDPEAADEPVGPNLHLPARRVGDPARGGRGSIDRQPRDQGAPVPFPQHARHQGERRPVVLLRPLDQRVLRRQPGRCREDGETTVGRGQGRSSRHGATIDQDGPDSVHPRTVQPLGHGVEASKRNRPASAQPPPHPAQEEKHVDLLFCYETLFISIAKYRTLAMHSGFL